MINTIYIISYLPDDHPRYKIRKKCLFQQVKWFLSQGRTFHLKYIIQCWSDELTKEFEDCFNDLNTECTYEFVEIHQKAVPPPVARNIHLRNFYDSDKDIAMFFDDDIIVETYDKDMSIFDFFDIYFQDINYHSMSFKFARYRNLHREYCYLKPTTEFGAGALIFKNINKLLGKKIFFDESLKALEDMDFGLELAYNKVIHYLCENPYLKELTAKSILFTGMEQRKEINAGARVDIFKKWSQRLGNTFISIKSGRLYQNNFKKLFLKHREIVLNKKEKYEEH